MLTEFFSIRAKLQGENRMFYTNRIQFFTFVLATTPKHLEFRRRRRLDDVFTKWPMRRTFVRGNFTSGRRRRDVSLSMLKFPNSILKPVLRDCFRKILRMRATET